MKRGFSLWLSTLVLFTACGEEPKNPWDSEASLPTEIINAAYYKLEHKVIDDTVNSGIILGGQPALDVELWLYDASGNVIAKFPMRWRFSSYGVSAYAWTKTKNKVALRNINGLRAIDILGGYTGSGGGLAIGWGRTEFNGSNDAGAKIFLLFDRAGLGLDASFAKASVYKGSAEQTHSWDSVIRLPSDIP